jgi:hypothetical protein
MASHWFQKEENKQRHFLINMVVGIGPWNFLYVIISSCSDIPPPALSWSIQKLPSDLGELCITGGGLCHQRYNLMRFTELII